MQPHSISAMAVAKHIWALNYGLKIPTSAEVQIDWTTPHGKRKSIYHFISKIEVSKKDKNDYITELRITVQTTDGTPCTLTVRRLTDGEFKQNERVVATHSVQHVAGLEEHYELSRKSIRGYHRRSEKYGDFVCTDAGENSFVLYCSVKVTEAKAYHFKRIPYKVTVRPRGETPMRELIKKETEEIQKKGFHFLGIKK